MGPCLSIVSKVGKRGGRDDREPMPARWLFICGPSSEAGKEAGRAPKQVEVMG